MTPLALTPSVNEVVSATCQVGVIKVSLGGLLTGDRMHVRGLSVSVRVLSYVQFRLTAVGPACQQFVVSVILMTHCKTAHGTFA